MILHSCWTGLSHWSQVGVVRTCPCPQETRAVASRWGCCLHGSRVPARRPEGEKTAFTTWPWPKNYTTLQHDESMCPQHGSVTGYNCEGASLPSGHMFLSAPLGTSGFMQDLVSFKLFPKRFYSHSHRSVKYLQGIRKAIFFRRISRGKN